jgi:hypothetical protein
MVIFHIFTLILHRCLIYLIFMGIDLFSVRCPLACRKFYLPGF